MSDPDPRVQLARSGGVAGITLRASCQIGELSTDEAAALDHLLARAAPAPPGAGPGGGEGGGPAAGGADRYQYDLTVTDQEGQHVVSFQEHELEPEERRVLNRLIATRRAPGQER